MKNKPKISVVVPVHNEEESVFSLYWRICHTVEMLRTSFEIVFVDDASTDQTLPTLKRIHRDDARVKVLSFRTNYGQTAALAAGIKVGQGEIIISMDGDLQNDPADIPRLLTKLDEEYDMVCGWRQDRKDNLVTRTIPSVVANWVISKICGVPIHDSGCTFKAYRATVIKRIRMYGEMHRFLPAMALLVGARIGEVVVRHHPRKFGKTKYGSSRIWKVFLDLFTVKMLVTFASRPASWFGLLSLPFGLSAFLGFGAIAVLVATEQDFSLIVVGSISILFAFTAIHLVSMGLLAETALVAERGKQRNASLPEVKKL